MRKILAAAFATAMVIGSAVYAQTAEDAVGVWLNPENKSHTEFYKCGDGVCAKIVKVADGQKTDDKNPDPAKRNRAIVGLVIMQGAKKAGPNKWSGSLYNRADGKTYSGTLTVKSKTEVDLSGCVAAVFCKTTTFTRVK
ncbi:MAG: DUF2147 domain-containing protein [Hyphomonadaceae bacterium]|jgi:uncharacterized protein (DUF2147 family)|nr:DUF2147 domain-containing protein [Hyphomonadaceae bacterium]